MQLRKVHCLLFHPVPVTEESFLVAHILPRRDAFLFKLDYTHNTVMQAILNLFYMRATRGAHNPNLQVVVTHASHVCSQH